MLDSMINLDGDNNDENSDSEFEPQITPYIIFAALTAAVGPFFFGWNLSVLNNPSEELKGIYNESHYSHYGKYVDESKMISLETMASAFYLCGGVFGSLIFGVLVKRIGRKRIMQVISPIGFIGALLMLLTKPANALECMLIGRILFGIYSGASMGVAPVYITEISATRFQGKMSAITGAGVTFGAFVSSLLGVKDILGNGNLLLVLFGIPLIILAVQFGCLFFCPETPKYLLLQRNDQIKTVETLQKLRKCSDKNLMRDEIRLLEIEKSMMQAGMVNFSGIFKKRYLKRTVIIIVCNAAQQLCGVNGILFYSNSIFTSAGLNNDEATYGSVGVSGVLFIGSCLSTLLLERIGRRPLLLIGFATMSIASFGLVPALKFAHDSRASAIISILLKLVFMLLFSIGPGTIVWMLTSELFTFEARPPAILMGVTVNWLSNLLLVSIFLYIQNAFGAYIFAIFGAVNVASSIFIYFFVPETKNKNAQDVELMFINN